MAILRLSSQEAAGHHLSLPKTLIHHLNMERRHHHHPNVDRSACRKRRTRRFQRNDEYCDNETNYHGKQRGSTVFAPVRILKRGEVLDERPPEADLSESTERKLRRQAEDCSSDQIVLTNSSAAETYAGLICTDSPHPSSVPLPTFLLKRDDLVSRVNRRPAPDLDLHMVSKQEFLEVLN